MTSMEVEQSVANDESSTIKEEKNNHGFIVPEVTFLELKRIVNEMDEVNPDPKKFFEIRMMANTLLNRAKRVRRANGAEARKEIDRSMLESTDLAQKKQQENIDILEQLERMKKQKAIEYRPAPEKSKRTKSQPFNIHADSSSDEDEAKNKSDQKEIEGENTAQEQNEDTAANEPDLQKKLKVSADSAEKPLLKDGSLHHLSKPKSCYVCHEKYNRVHKFYHSMCLSCGDYNFEKRVCDKPDLTGKVAVITGGRIKIGYLSSILLLRQNCQVHVTTRFPKDALERYKKEPDYEKFKDNLSIYSLDFRDVGSVIKFCDFFKTTIGKLDYLINNAAQCVRRTASYFNYLLDTESKPLKEIAEADLKVFSNDQALKSFQDNPTAMLTNGLSNSNEENVANYAHCHLADSVLMNLKPVLDGEKSTGDHLYPKGVVDSNGIQVDLAPKNSWTAKIEEVPIFEFMETQVINAWAPFVLCQKLLTCMISTPEQAKAHKYIVNVSSVEGKFHMRRKPSAHPHNNMSKASLNMLTRTVGPQYAKDYNIFMTCVDTGWVSNDMIPQSFVFDNVYKATPLDELDGALRVVDPIFEGVKTNSPVHTVFFQNYQQSNW